MKQNFRVMLAGLLVLATSAQARQDDGQQQSTRKKQPQKGSAAAPPAQTAAKPPVGRQAAGTRSGQIAYPTAGAVTPRLRRPLSPRSAPQGEKNDVRQIRARHANFHAKPKPQQVPPMVYDENRRIKGSEQWHGEKYSAFRAYHPHQHDRNWYRKHCHHIVFICGGYYYWDNFYWYPAWGYDPFYSYYVYDGPIYAATVEDSPDQVIADVQAALQELGYYDGEVDGILGEPTRDAISAYQSDNELYQTGAIDQPTLELLGLN